MRLFARGAMLCSLLVLVPAASAAAAPTVSDFAINPQDTDPLGIAPLTDGNVLFAERSTSDFGVSTPAGTTSEVSGLSAPAAAVAVYRDQAWVTEPGAGQVALITHADSASKTVTPFSLPGAAQPVDITIGPNGSPWFTESSPAAIGTIVSGTPVRFMGSLPANSQLAGITAGPDGNLWFTQGNPAGIDKMTTSGSITTYTTGLAANSDPTGITTGPDGNLWFTQDNPAGIDKMTTSGSITTYTTGLTANSDPTSITAGPGGDLWFTEAGNAGAIGWITPQGVISQIATPTVNGAPQAITEVSDDDLWFTEDGGSGRLGKLIVPPPTVATQAAFSVGQTSAILPGTINPGGFPATYHFAWGTSISYGTNLPATDTSAGTASTPSTVTQTLTGLTPGTVYHYRLVATNCGGCGAGTADGSDMTFTTASPPPTTTTTTTSTTTPTTTTATSPTATAPTTVVAPVAPPAIGKTAVAAVTSGTVLVKVPGSGQLEPLAADQNIPLGSLVDARSGRLDVTTAISKAGRTQSAAVWGGEFVLGQTGKSGMTTFRLADTGLDCSTEAGAGHTTTETADRAVAAKKKKKKKSSLWASDDHGRYSTRGQNSVATVRGTEWETTESCAGTLTHVKKGLVSVQDLHTHRTVLVHAGHSFLARP